MDYMSKDSNKSLEEKYEYLFYKQGKQNMYTKEQYDKLPKDVKIYLDKLKIY